MIVFRSASKLSVLRSGEWALRASRAGWTLADQAVVSAGTFFVNIILARHLELAEYGVFSLLFATALISQILIASFVGYPLTVRLPSVTVEEAKRLSTSSIFVSAALCIPLGVVFVAVLLILHRPDIILPSLVWFFFWQLQQATRRTYLADLRYRDALVGDSISALGQVLVVSVLAAGSLSLYTTLFCMAAAPGIGAAVQMLRGLKALSLRDLYAPHRWLIEHAYLGGWSFAMVLLHALRGNAVLWCIVAASGTETVGAFQAALNIFLLLNPIQLGLANLIPQVTARAYVERDKSAAWKAARPYILGALPPTFVYLACVVINPEFVLRLFYGGAQHYQGLSQLFPTLAVFSASLIATELIFNFLYGLQEVRVQAAINLAGFVSAMILVLIFFRVVGPLEGAAIAFAGAELIRLALTLAYLRRLLPGGHSVSVTGQSGNPQKIGRSERI